MGAAKGTLRADQTNFRKKGTGNPVLIAKKEGKHPNSHFTTSAIPESIEWEQVKKLIIYQWNDLSLRRYLRTFYLPF